MVAQRTADDDEVLKTGKPLISKEELMENAAGVKQWLSTTKVPLRDAEGKILGIVVISRDITEHKLAQEEVIATNKRLREAVIKLKNAHDELHSLQLQLIEAEKMKSIGRLSAGVAHEVKNPLAIIDMGLAYLLQADGFAAGAEVPQVLKEMRDAVQRADAVVKGLLDFSAPKQLDVQDEDINEIIEKSLILVRGEMKGPRFRVVKEFNGHLPLKLDRLKIEQVFVNLFTNAIHAMPKGGTLTIRSSFHQHAGVGENVGDSRSESFRIGGTLVVVEIEDEGTGIPADKLTKIFDPFFTTKTTGEGTGLGLSVTKTIIDLHRGTIEIHNRQEGGARVTLMFEV